MSVNPSTLEMVELQLKNPSNPFVINDILIYTAKDEYYGEEPFIVDRK